MKQILQHVKVYFRWYLLLALAILSIVLWSVILREDHKGILTFAVLNIGQGDSLFIESPTGTQVLIDGGLGKNLMKEIAQVVPWYDRHIDMLVVTNPDKDHYEGFIPLLDKYKVDIVLESGTFSPTPTYTYLEKEIKDKNIPEILARRGQIVDLGGGAYLEILFPDRDVTNLASNDGSIVMRLVYGDTSVALQGDSTERIEHYLAGLDPSTELRASGLQSTILKAGHHGSKTSSSEEYVKAVDPRWTVISAGSQNKYGHPTQETLDTMAKLKIPTLVTCNMGRIVFHSDGKNFTLENKKIIEPVVGCVN